MRLWDGMPARAIAACQLHAAQWQPAFSEWPVATGILCHVSGHPFTNLTVQREKWNTPGLEYIIHILIFFLSFSLSILFLCIPGIWTYGLAHVGQVFFLWALPWYLILLCIWGQGLTVLLRLVMSLQSFCPSSWDYSCTIRSWLGFHS